ncbi:type IV pilus secretin PilQ [Aquabacterium sp.]|uniref:type IV pilus secretin PilQ n=1 Tax=Aquabacterium sp. TaxID=1872578 RepID=UPI0035B24DEB
MKRLRWVLASLALCVAAPQAWAENAIQSINSTQQAGAQVLRIELAEPLAAVPQGFVVQTPPRIALDFPSIANATGRSLIDVNQGNLRSVNMAQAGDRTRVVLNLRTPSTYKAQLEGKSLLVIIEPAANAAAAPAAAASASPKAGETAGTTKFAESLNNSPSAIRDVDFRRGQDGAGRVVVELPNNQVGVDIRQQGQSLVVEFQRATLPQNLRKRFDVTDFGTPVQSMQAVQVGDRVRLTVEPRGAWEHSAYQTDNQFVLEVRPQKVDPNKLTQGPGYSGEKLSLNFQNIEVRALLQVIADFTNFNVVTSDTVTGNVTLRLKDVPWDQALDIILQAKGLGVRKSGNVLWIAPKDEINTKEKIDLEAKQQIAALEPVRTQSFQLNYAKAEDILKGLTGQSSGGGGGASSRILTPRGSAISEQRTNQLFVSDIPSKLEEIQALIAKIDVPVRQVLIEARIVEADESWGRSLGARLGATTGSYNPFKVGGGNGLAVNGSYLNTGYQTGQVKDVPDFIPYSNFVNMPASGLGTGVTPSSVAFTLLNGAANRLLNLEISALESEGRGKIVSSPRVITADQIKAVIEQGTELPYQTATSSGATAIIFRKANLKLEVTPQITPEGSIILDVDVNKDSVGQETRAGYAIDTKHVKTQVLVENGGTVVIGGIFLEDERDSVVKVPYLGDVPVLGNLFRTKTRQTSKSELMVFLTPKVVTDRTALR